MEKYKLTVVYENGIEKEHFFEASEDAVIDTILIFQTAFEEGRKARITIPYGNSTSVVNVSKVLECTFEKLESKAN